MVGDCHGGNWDVVFFKNGLTMFCKSLLQCVIRQILTMEGWVQEASIVNGGGGGGVGLDCWHL